MWCCNCLLELRAGSFDIIRAALPHHTDLPEPVHNPNQWFAGAHGCRTVFSSADIFFEDLQQELALGRVEGGQFPVERRV
jgi:hypothetical protein